MAETLIRRAAAFLLTAACCCSNSAPPGDPPPKRTATTQPAEDAGLPVTAPSWGLKQRAAMASIYYHARFGLPKDIPEKDRPIPLEEAARIIQSTSGKGAAESRRRRAIAKIYAMETQDKELKEARAKALKVLHAPVSDLDKRFTPKKGTWNRALPSQGSPYVRVQYAPVESAVSSFVALLEFLERLMGDTGMCERTPPQSVSQILANNVIVVTTQIDVKRSIPDLKPVVDPQHWDTCGGEYFAEACVPEVDATGKVVISPTTQLPICATSAPDPSQLWSGILYENFIVGFLWFEPVSFHTIINIDKRDEAGGVHRTAFTLNQSLGGYIGPFKGKCDIDEGGAKLTPSAGGWVHVEGSKKLRLVFDSQTVTNWMTRLTAATIDSAADEIYESICCEP